MTKKQYEEYLNDLYAGDGETCLNHLAYIVKHHPRTRTTALAGKYGTLLRRYDPIAFEVGKRDSGY